MTATTSSQPAGNRLALLYRLSQTFNLSLDLDEVLNRVMDEVIAAVDAERGFLMLREADGTLVFRVARGMDRSTIDEPEFEVSRSVVERVAQEGQPVLTGNAQLDDRFRMGTSIMDLQLRSILCVPLTVRERIQGVVYVDNRLRAGIFGQEDLDLLAAIASSAAAAIENARLYDEAQKRVVEMETLRRTSLQLTSSLDLSAVLQAIGESVMALVSATDCIIYLYDQKSQRFSFGTALGEWARTDSITLPRPDGLTATVVREGQPVVIDNATIHPLFATPEAQRWGIQATAAFPLIGARGILGVLHVVFMKAHTFRQAELRVLGLLSDQAAIAIENARLFEAERDQLEELTVLHAVATAGAEAAQEDWLIERVTQIIGETLYPADVFGVLLLDEEAGVLRLHRSYMVMDRMGERWPRAMDLLPRDSEGSPIVPLGQGITGTVAATGRPLCVGDVSQVPEFIDGGVETCSELSVPLKAGDRVLGVINAESRQRDAFSEADERLMATVAGQLATAIEKLRLYEAAQQEIAMRREVEEELRKHRDHLEELVDQRTAALTEINLQLKQEIEERRRAEAEREQLLVAERAQARRQAALFRLSAELAATLDEAEVGHRVVHGLRDTLGYDFVAAFLVDEATGDRVHIASAGPIEPPARIPAGKGLSARPLLHGQLQYTPDVSQDPNYIQWLGGSEVDVPLRIGGEVLGVLIAESRQTHAFDGHDFEVLTAAAQQAGLAIEKARLLAAERKRADELDALRTTMADIAAELELSALLKVIVERASGLLEATGGELGLYDEESQEIEIVVSHNMGESYVGTRHAPGEGAMGQVAQTGKPLIIDDYQAWTGRAPQYDALRFYGVIAAPLEVGGRLLGVITTADANPDRKFSDDDMHLLSMFAQQATIALENAQLFDQAQREIAERVRAEAELRRYQEHLEELVTERTAELRQSEERYRSLFDGVPVGLYRTTPAGEVLDTNPAMVDMLGYPSRESLLAINSASLYVDPGERLRWQALMEQAGIVRDFETQMHKQDDTVIWVNNAARAVRDERGQVLHYEGSLEDITERKRAEAELRRYQEHLEDLVEERTAELRQSEQRYRTLFDGVPVGLYRALADGQILDANPAAAEMLGYASREELLATNMAKLFVRPLEAVRARLLADQVGIVRDFESRLRRKDGRIMWINYTARAVRDQEDKVLHYEGSLEDITDRRRFEEELRRQKDYFEALFVNSPVAVTTTDLEMNTLSWNPVAEKLFGYSQDEAIGQNLDELIASDPQIHQEAIDYTSQVQQRGRVQATTQRTRKDGTRVDVEVLAVPVMVAGEQVGCFAMYHDITPLQEARREAEAANQAKSTFLANMSHELRTPLNAILGFSQLMEGDRNLTTEQQENLGIINRSGEHLLGLINDVLDMSKIEAGRMSLQEVSFDLHQLLDGLEGMFRLRSESKGLTFTLQKAEDMPRYAVADEGKLRQMLSNLLGNAVKFTQKGSVMLRVRVPCWIGAGDREMLCFEVEDTGPGIAPEDLETVFDPFVQATGAAVLAARQAQEGTGLGLAISRQFARLMGGDITADSKLGQGSLFQLEVPLRRADAAEVGTAGPRPKVRGLAPGQRANDGSPFRLLIVEDRVTNRRLLVKLLTDLGEPPNGFEIREANNGQEAIEIWAAWQPHLIWMDMRMPVMDGCEATRRIKARPGGKETTIIALTATAFEEDRDRILLEGCDDFLRKPFRKEEIFDMLSEHLGVRFVYEEEPAQPTAPEPKQVRREPEVVKAVDLAALPAVWASELREATIRADLNRIEGLVEEIRPQNPSLADSLLKLADNFEYQQILDLLEATGG